MQWPVELSGFEASSAALYVGIQRANLKVSATRAFVGLRSFNRMSAGDIAVYPGARQATAKWSVRLIGRFLSFPALIAAGLWPRPTGLAEGIADPDFGFHLLNGRPAGAYLVRALGRQHKIFMDGRTQLFEDAGVFQDSLRIGKPRRRYALLAA